MSVEHLSPEAAVQETYRRNYGATVVVKGDIPEYDLENVTTGTKVWTVVFELLNNCAENRLLGSSVGAKRIEVIFEPGKVTVKDDFVYERPKEVLKLILEIRDSREPRTTKPFIKGRFPGGAGIFTSTKTLRELGGNLDYYVEDGTIVAVGTWKTQ